MLMPITPVINAITIDGPVASGKTTIGKLVADRLGFFCLDTGIMYRAVTWAAIPKCVQESLVVTMANQIEMVEGHPYYFLNDTASYLIPEKQLYTDAVNRFVSLVSSYKGVRDMLSKKQRSMGLAGNIVMVGRDCGN